MDLNHKRNREGPPSVLALSLSAAVPAALDNFDTRGFQALGGRVPGWSGEVGGTVGVQLCGWRWVILRTPIMQKQPPD